MSTFILSPDDTIVMSDSMIVKIMKISGTSQTCINETANNWADVEIAKQISCTIITIAIVFVVGYTLARIIDTISACCSEHRKRMWEEEDRNYKRETELLDKLLNFKEKQGTAYMVDEDGRRIDKDKNRLKEDEQAINDYISLLEHQLKIQYPKQNETENKVNS